MLPLHARAPLHHCPRKQGEAASSKSLQMLSSQTPHPYTSGVSYKPQLQSDINHKVSTSITYREGIRPLKQGWATRGMEEGCGGGVFFGVDLLISR